MRAVHENIDGPFVIGEDLAVYGLVTAGATLRAGVKLILHGTIAGDLIIEPGARAIIHGTVAGRICNEGGGPRFSAWSMPSRIYPPTPRRSSMPPPMSGAGGRA